MQQYRSVLLWAVMAVAAHSQTLEFELNPEVTASGNFFGGDVAVTDDYIAVCADTFQGGKDGFYVFDAVTGQQLYWMNSGPFHISGFAVDLDETYGIYGGVEIQQVSTGFVRIFNIATGNVIFQVSAGGGPGGWGSAVAVSGDLAIAGRHFNNPATGIARIYHIPTQTNIFTFNKPGQFGGAVDIDGNLAVVGTVVGEIVYVYELTGGELALEIPAPTGITTFGQAVGIEGSHLVVGAPQAERAFVYELPSGNLLHTFAPASTSPSKSFGTDVAIQGNRVVVSAPREEHSGFPFAGAAYVYDLPTGTQLYRITSPAPAPFEDFSSGVAVLGDRVVIGAPRNDDLGSSTGKVFVYALDPAPVVYCQPKVSSSFCINLIATSQPTLPPTSGSGDLFVTCFDVQALKNGLLFAGISGPDSTPFSGGVLCVAPPLKRGPLQNSGGTSPLSCSGSFSQLVNDGVTIPFGLDPGPGNTAWYQWWYRDPDNGPGPLGTALSNGVELAFL